MKNPAKSITKSPTSVASLNEQAKVLPFLNPKREPLSPAILKSFPSYQLLTDAEAEEKCTSIRTFARLLLEYLASVKNTISIDNQHVVTLEGNQDSKIIAINSKKSKPKAA